MRNLESILITGGAGFIGSNLCHYFVGQGKRVICLDNLLTGSEENIQALKAKSNFSFVQGDIRDLTTCRDITKDVDSVSHQAALGSVPRSIENPVPTNEINCQGFLNLLTAARDNGLKRFVYASSSSVYGDSQASPKKEDKLGKPLSPYAVSKLTNELYGKVFHDLYGLETIGLRYFNVFGRNQDPNGAYAAAIPKFIAGMKQGIAPQVYGDGSQTRDFTHVTNVIYANLRALTSQNKSAYGKVFNVACGKSYSLNFILDLMRAELASLGYSTAGLDTRYVDPRKGDIQHSLADISSIQTELDYEVQTNFEEGLKIYIRELSARK